MRKAGDGVTTIFAICGAAISLAALVAAGRMQGYTAGKKAGYEEGFQAGHKKADDWWVNWECEVTKTREVIRNEEGWP
jgi:flagellar biosynthesis/type III secretory pathway protein FliH